VIAMSNLSRFILFALIGFSLAVMVILLAAPAGEGPCTPAAQGARQADITYETGRAAWETTDRHCQR
jgi:hypothetical protein